MGAILQISHRHLDKHLDSKSDQNNNLSSNNASTLKNKSTTDFCVQVRMDSFINDSLVPTEVPLDQTQQTIGNNNNNDIDDESNSNFTKDKAIEERDEEIEKLIQQSIENEEEIM